MEIDFNSKEVERVDERLDKHITNGLGWRVAVAGSAVVILVQIALFIHFNGRMTEMLDRHDKIIDRIEKKVFP